MRLRLISLFTAIIVFEMQVVLLDLLSKAENMPVSFNPLNAISAVGFVLGWTTGLNHRDGADHSGSCSFTYPRWRLLSLPCLA